MNARASLVPAENKRELREDVTDNNIDDPIAEGEGLKKRRLNSRFKR